MLVRMFESYMRKLNRSILLILMTKLYIFFTFNKALDSLDQNFTRKYVLTFNFLNYIIHWFDIFYINMQNRVYIIMFIYSTSLKEKGVC